MSIVKSHVWNCVCANFKRMLSTMGVESKLESPALAAVLVLAPSRNLSFEGDSDSRPYQSHLDFV